MVNEDGQPIQRGRRRRRKDAAPGLDEAMPSPTPHTPDDEVSTFLQLEEEAERLAKTGRECPVPKPGGVIGELLGFPSQKDPQLHQQSSRSGGQ